MGSIFSLIVRVWQIYSPPVVPKSRNALKFGILGAANIAKTVLIKPAKSHPEVIVQAVAARDKQRAEIYAKKYGIPQVHDSYEAILDDPSIDAVYIPLPPSLHFEWAIKALTKGKHVLVEKPAVVNAQEAAALFGSPLLQKPNAPVLLEAMHHKFQPTWQYFLSLVDRENLEHVHCTTKLPPYIIPESSVQLNHETGGGNLLNLGTYGMSILRDVFGTEPEECTSCTIRKASLFDLSDEAADATFRFPGGLGGEISSDMRANGIMIPTFNITVTDKPVEVEDASLAAGQKKLRVRKLHINNFMMAAAWHRIDIEDEYIIQKSAGEQSGVLKRWTKRESKKVYTFKDAGIDQPSEASWVSFRHQLEQFVDRVRGRKGSGLWVSNEDSLAQAKVIDMAYEKSGLPLRHTSKFVQAETST